MRKRLLKDLPFANLKTGDVIRNEGGRYLIHHGESFYEGGGSSDKGIENFGESEDQLLDKIWDDCEWFEDAELKHIELVPKTGSITLRFDPIDIEDAETLAKGIIHILPELTKGNHTWNKFKDITTAMRNN